MIKEDLENYLYVAREKIPGFIHDSNRDREDALLLSIRCSRMHGNIVILRPQERINKYHPLG